MVHDTTRAILFYISEGLSTKQILAENPELAAEDIQAAGAEALRVIEAGESREDRIARVRQKHPHAFEPWTPKDDQDLLAEWTHGASLAALSRAFGRPTGALRMRLEKLSRDPKASLTPPSE